MGYIVCWGLGFWVNGLDFGFKKASGPEPITACTRAALSNKLRLRFPWHMAKHTSQHELQSKLNSWHHPQETL